MAREITQELIETFLENDVEGQITLKDIWEHLGIGTARNKENLRKIMQRCTEKGLVQRLGKYGTYRKVNSSRIPMKWQEADPTNTLNILLPFNIHKYCRIYPKSIIVVAGEKNAGKTSFLYETVYLNMHTFKVDLYNSETGPEQMNERLKSWDIPNPAPFSTFEAQSHFADLLVPENMSVIDYLDMDSELYLIGAEINAMFQKITTGVAVIGIQKPPATVTYNKGKKETHSRDLGYGGAFSAKRAVLYISLGQRKCKLVYIKTPAKGTIVPDNMTWTYDIDEYGRFANIQRYYGEQSEF